MRTRHLAMTFVVGAVAVWSLTFVRLGGFSARAQPSLPERLVARAARRLTVPRAGRDARNPIPFSPEIWAEARAHFADHCAACHGNDGRGHTDMGRNLYPKAPDMRLPDTQRLTDGELYWIIQNGVRLTGMPAWGDGSDSDVDTYSRSLCHPRWNDRARARQERACPRRGHAGLRSGDQRQDHLESDSHSHGNRQDRVQTGRQSRPPIGPEGWRQSRRRRSREDE